MSQSATIRALFKIVAGVSILLLFSGCHGNPFTTKTDPADHSGQHSEKTKKTTAVYHDFQDILVPMELEVLKGKTMIVTTPGYRSGVLTLKGAVESTSLYNFFNINMLQDNWSVISQIKSPGTTIMVFRKPSKCAVITIRDEQFSTYVEIGVAPTLENETLPDSNLLESDLSG